MTIHDNLLTCYVLQNIGFTQFYFTVSNSLLRSLRTALRNPANVEGPHGQLSARLTDGLRRNNAHSLTRVHLSAPCQIAAITHGTNTVLGLTSERRAHLHRDHASRFNRVRQFLVKQSIARCQHLIRARLQHIFSHNAAQNALGERRNNRAVIHRSRSFDRRFGTAIFLTHDTVLRNVNQTAGQVTRVRRFKRCIGKAFTRAVG